MYEHKVFFFCYFKTSTFFQECNYGIIEETIFNHYFVCNSPNSCLPFQKSHVSNSNRVLWYLSCWHNTSVYNSFCHCWIQDNTTYTCKHLCSPVYSCTYTWNIHHHLINYSLFLIYIIVRTLYWFPLKCGWGKLEYLWIPFQYSKSYFTEYLFWNGHWV